MCLANPQLIHEAEIIFKEIKRIKCKVLKNKNKNKNLCKNKMGKGRSQPG
jgi:ribosomal protein S28E/S33